MSFPNHPTFDIEDAFSSNSPDYIPAFSDYFPTSSRNTSSDSSVNPSGLIPIASPTPLLFHDDPYMKVMHAYYAKELPILTPITSSTILSPSPVLPLPLFNPRDFFVVEELLPPKKQVCFLSSSSTNSSDLPQNQAYNLALPSFSVYTPTPPQIFEIGKSYIKMTSTSETLAITLAAIRQLIADSVVVALEAQAATIANTNHTNRNTKPSKTLIARKGTSDHKRKFNDRRNTTSNDNNNYPNNRDNNNHPNDHNHNNHCNNRKKTNIKITTTTTTVTTITTNSRIEGKKLSRLMLPRQLRTKGTAEAKDQPWEAIYAYGEKGYYKSLCLKIDNSTFHVSNLKKYLSDKSLVISMKEIWLNDKLNFVEEPIEIMDQEVK
nr:putative reverse transcriptase domain-containing protein [Tanacetum cinerariifolium]